MYDFEILGKSSRIFAIKWQDKSCEIADVASANISQFITLTDTFSSNFTQLLSASSDIEARKLAVSQLSNLPSAQLSYSIKGVNGKVLQVSEEIVQDPKGDLISIFTEITTLHKQKNELAETSERLELVLEGTRLGLWDWDPQTNDVFFDQRWAEMLGLSMADLTQTLADWQDRVHPDDIEGCFKDIMLHIDGKIDFYENTHRMKHADGSWRYILDRGRIVKRDKDGNPIRFTGTHTDVTALKHAEQRALNALSGRNQFFARMSHEIRTPLHGILGTADILSRKALTPDAQQLVGVINQSGSLLESLLNDILDISKLEEGALVLATRDVDILVTLTSAFALFEEKARTKNLIYEFKNDTQKQAIGIHTDPTRVNQVISNLLSNSIKFTDSGFVKLTVKIVNNELLVSVADSGVGIEDTRAIFAAYNQEGGLESKSQGTGLGLSIVETLCKKLNIGLTLTSSVNAGTRFTLNMGKIHEFESPKPENEQISHSAKVDLSTKRALVVDDNEINLIVAKTLLAEHFSDVCIAYCGNEAIEKVRSSHYDVVFMDFNMPGMNGVETAEKINQLGLPRPPIIIGQTADATDYAKMQFSDSQIKHVITKPFTQEKLLATLGQLKLPKT